MDCKYCGQPCRKSGRQGNGVQRYYCRDCAKYQQQTYVYQACQGAINGHIQSLVCEGVGIRGVARVLKIAAGTVLSRIRALAESIARPYYSTTNPAFEIDELWTYIGRKDNEYWIAYGLDRKSRRVVD